MSINPFNISNQLIPEDSENDEPEIICVICQENINNAPAYTLPECKHQYHTHCIVTWFRSQPKYDFDDTGNNVGACPLCGNKGINHISNKRNKNRRRWRSPHIKEAEKYRKTAVLKYAKRDDAPKELLKLINDKNEKHKKLEALRLEFKKIKDDIKNNPSNFYDTKKSMATYRNNIWTAETKLKGIETAITYFPIVPIIIPQFVDLN
tara:strand:+ start:376 stop:996 length:621 start_codon:yes stop_codon:yes gene_type:complete